jgi:amino acid adenylation domain-containing protein
MELKGALVMVNIDNHPNQGAQLQLDRSFWLNQLHPGLAPTNLRLDFNRPNEYRGETGSMALGFSSGLREKLAKLTGSDPFLTYATLMAVLQITLFRYTRSETIVVGSPLLKTGKILPDGALVIAHPVDETLDFRQFLLNIRALLLEAYQHQNYPLDSLRQELGIEDALNKCPLFDVILSMSDIHHRLPPLKNDMTLTITRNGKELGGTIEYNQTIFRLGTIIRFEQSFRNILEQALDNTGITVAQLLPLTAAEQLEMLIDWNATTVEYPAHTCLHQHFEAQAARNPDAVALIYDKQRFSYRELNERANQLAHYLISLQIGPDVLVGLFIDRSPEMIIGLLGVLKAGGAYVPIDPTYPKDRIEAMLSTARFPVLLTREPLVERLPDHNCRLVRLDSEWPVISGESAANPINRVTADNLCYVIFTSGSTGAPKAAAVHHQGWANLLNWFSKEFNVSEQDKGLIISSFSFDITQRSIAMPLINGGELHLLPSSYYDPELILQTVHDHQITLLNCSPSTFYPLVENGKESAYDKLTSLRCLFLGGEAISASRLVKWVNSGQCGALIANVYGAAECSDVSAFYTLHDFESYVKSSVPAGKAIYNTQVYIVNEKLEPVPAGVVGEICLAGDGVGKGYINDPVLTAQKFIANPFTPGTLLYKTGDLGRFLPDGNIEFNGRIDHQVKIRGLRIELGDIESALRQHPFVKEAVVLDKTLASGDQHLVAYLVPETPVSIDDSIETERFVGVIRQFVKAKLPGFMIPGFFLVLREFPLNPNGKIDRKALPEPDYAQTLAAAAAEAMVCSTTEKELIEVYNKVLGQIQVGVDDNFFEIGGHSLMATQVVSIINERFGIKLSLADLLAEPTVAGLAKRVERKAASLA